jgi:hypothetical protein
MRRAPGALPAACARWAVPRSAPPCTRWQRRPGANAARGTRGAAAAGAGSERALPHARRPAAARARAASRPCATCPSSRAASTLALVGESGCGKTTTGKAIVQLLRTARRASKARRCWTGATCSSCRATRCARPRRDADHLPGPVRLAEPAHARARVAGRGPGRRCSPTWTAPARARSASRRWRAGGPAPRRAGRASRTSSPAASASASPSPARWRCSPADRLRRADLGAGRVGAGADPEPAARAAARAGLELPVHHPQHRRGRVHRRPRWR